MKANLSGQRSTIFSGLGMNDIMITHTIPYFIGLWTPSKEEAANGAKEEVFYASNSANGGFKVEGEYIPFDTVNYKTIDQLYIDIEIFEGSNGAFRYIRNIISVSLRVIQDCKQLRNNNQCTYEQYDYIHDNTIKLIRKCEGVLRFNKQMLEADGKDMCRYSVSTTVLSKYSQLSRVARGLRCLIHNKIV